MSDDKVSDSIKSRGKSKLKTADAWCKYLEENLQFLFTAEIMDEPGPLEVGDVIKVTGIDGVYDLYGIVVNARMGRKKYSFPLTAGTVNGTECRRYTDSPNLLLRISKGVFSIVFPPPFTFSDC